jgi:hypothetical protein
MSTKNLLIIFAILLLLLTVLSAFGGSITPKVEYFTNNSSQSSHPFENFFDSSLIVPSEDGQKSQTNNPIFQNQSSSDMGFSITKPPSQNIVQVADSMTSVVEPFEEEDKLASFGPY